MNALSAAAALVAALGVVLVLLVAWGLIVALRGAQVAIRAFLSHVATSVAPAADLIARVGALETELASTRRAVTDLDVTIENRHKVLAGIISRERRGQNRPPEVRLVDDETPATPEEQRAAFLQQIAAATTPPQSQQEVPSSNGERRGRLVPLR